MLVVSPNVWVTWGVPQGLIPGPVSVCHPCFPRLLHRSHWYVKGWFNYFTLALSHPESVHLSDATVTDSLNGTHTQTHTEAHMHTIQISHLIPVPWLPSVMSGEGERKAKWLHVQQLRSYDLRAFRDYCSGGGAGRPAVDLHSRLGLVF